MSKYPKIIIGKWQFFYNSGIPVMIHSDIFTREVNFGVFKLTKAPAEGARLNKAEYKGFILRWYYWFPFKREKQI